MPDLLLEIGLEEVPARMIAGAQAELLRRTLALLGKEALLPKRFDPLIDAASYSTPRRLAVLVRGVIAQQPDLTEEVTGPAVKIAFKDGVATPAAEAFARKSGVAVSELKTVQTPKGEYLAATSLKKGRSASEVIAAEVPKEIAAIYWAKNMYWRAGKPERFVRPVLWLVCLLGEEIVPLEFAGKAAGRATYGHRVLSSGEAFEIVTPESYVAQLEGEFVLVDVEARRQKIRKALDHATRAVPSARWRKDEALVDTVTHLTEWPDVLLGSFEPAFLALPEEVLVTVMRDHQKYFAVEDAEGKLAPHFLAVLNIALDATNEPIIRQGNERVLRARFNDARFFWEFDQRVPLIDRVKLLENVTFQKDLGSYAAKSERVVSICSILAGSIEVHGTNVDLNALRDAAGLAKADLTTELVKEFTELQGIIGGLYFKANAENDPKLGKERIEITWQAIYDQYLPASAKDPIPRSTEGAVLGLADRIDTIAGMFGLGMEPTGSKDPFALRRAANAVVRILAESGLALTLLEVIAASDAKEDVAAKMTAFFRERVEFYLRDVSGNAYDTVAAVMAAQFDDVRDVVARARAVSAVRGSEDFAAVSAAFKRMKNILAQAKEKGFAVEKNWDTNRFDVVSEIELAQEVTLRAPEIENLASGRDYEGALLEIAKFRPLLDAFFASVMVMCDDEDLRKRRLGLLATIESEFSKIADFSEIVTAGS